MQYMLLIYQNEAAEAAKTPEEHQQLFDDYMAFNEQVGKHIVRGDVLQATTTATTVRMRNGQTLITDGPFAETKEQLGGYYIIDAADLDEAIALAQHIPSVKDGSIEIRPLMMLN